MSLGALRLLFRLVLGVTVVYRSIIAQIPAVLRFLLPLRLHSRPHGGPVRLPTRPSSPLVR